MVGGGGVRARGGICEECVSWSGEVCRLRNIGWDAEDGG